MSDRTQLIQVTGRNGPLGWIHPEEQPENRQQVLVRLDNGQAVIVPADLLMAQEDGTYYLPMSRDQFESQGAATEITHSGGVHPVQTPRVIPVIAEEAAVSRRTVERGKIRLHKRVREREQIVDTETIEERVEVERVPINQTVDSPPEVRQEGDTLVFPVLEEELVVVKRLVLKEEVRVKRVRTSKREPRRVTLRSEEIQVEREDLEPNSNERYVTGG